MLSWSSHALRNAIALFYKRNKDGPVSSAVNTALLTSEIFSDNFNCQDAKEKGWHVERGTISDHVSLPISHFLDLRLG